MFYDITNYINTSSVLIKKYFYFLNHKKLHINYSQLRRAIPIFPSKFRTTSSNYLWKRNSSLKQSSIGNIININWYEILIRMNGHSFQALARAMFSFAIFWLIYLFSKKVTPIVSLTLTMNSKYLSMACLFVS